MLDILRGRARSIERYDLDRVYWLAEYNKTLDYGKQHSNTSGVPEQVDKLRAEKEQYVKEAEHITAAERAVEAEKYRNYEKWSKRKRLWGILEIVAFILAIVLMIALEQRTGYSRAGMVGVLLDIVLILLMLVWIIVGPIVFIVSAISKGIYAAQYKSYITTLSGRLNDMGQSFQRRAVAYYDTIDNLYLSTLDPTQREMLLFRREQQRHNEEMMQMEKERQRLQKKQLAEQQHATAATQKLLAIEEERERRYRGW